jgi:3-deoxy-7-phosphoheptulonate synthase
MSAPTGNLNIASNEAIITPGRLTTDLPLQGVALDSVKRARSTIFSILDRSDSRLFVVVGPCSIHDADAAIDYARKLKVLADEVQDTLYIVMRVYFEKPRTSIGWEGLIYDPHLDGTHRIEHGLRSGRELMLKIANIGLPIAVEALDLISPQYLQDLVTWTAIGARTTESPTHRKLASGISSAVGFKNSVDGNLSVAVNAIRSASASNSFISVTEEGKLAVFRTQGNQHCHVILRGGKSPNYDEESVAHCESELRKAALPENIMIDCSHGNSQKNFKKQAVVMTSVANQIAGGNQSIIGIMLESNLEEGNQPIPDDLDEIRYGVSVTDACLGWDATATLLREFSASIHSALSSR